MHFLYEPEIFFGSTESGSYKANLSAMYESTGMTSRGLALVKSLLNEGTGALTQPPAPAHGHNQPATEETSCSHPVAAAAQGAPAEREEHAVGAAGRLSAERGHELVAAEAVGAQEAGAQQGAEGPGSSEAGGALQVSAAEKTGMGVGTVEVSGVVGGGAGAGAGAGGAAAAAAAAAAEAAVLAEPQIVGFKQGRVVPCER